MRTRVNNTASGENIVTAKQLMNLETYGFLDVQISQEPRTDGKVLCSHGPDGKPDNEYLECDQYQAEELRNHLKKIGWAKTKCEPK